ncbi:probable protein S-acyltransferase 15 isoform X1 [Zingiber officinale]|uniref:probable protein S-acyltransferase 15 isoform X1 n=1 Tax=Zingiber officinale TaxID=94328 RepID=UPI001C4B720E|nr:probable protein S-acyltransferase 15 isoform X1 [Zingiber officinale]XP_042399383.1 probable protein S-acyltransferase 15 isoform X1 [Zingiber officinale]XP_042399384.1 probable protein S-acyltransferase 15 isoform X1 [Zingiber officinale]XP_042399385.1 probable protein S-acyltransferase 15 isoform X1 [Zingiber officinale]XP_042399387.1 probable protein S-acyltransferase 15 isoform X1 [Zingiber officinale]XP_042399388.1 probable protein S-acyltransferase 15 isoform X1 [Zingiber officinale]
MLGLRFPRPKRSPLELLRSTLFSCSLVLFSQFALALVPWLFPFISFLAMLPIAALIIVVAILLGRFLRRRLGVSASAPALVLFNVLFMWGVYVTIIRKAIPSLLDAVLNAVCALLLYGLYRILSGDLGTVSYSSSTLESGQNEFVTLNVQCEQSSPTLPRVRYCKSCKASIKGFDNHCPAFGNCIGNKNHRLLIVLLAGFLIAESSYTMSSTKFLTKTADAQRIESILANSLVISTMLFCILQVLWQVLFLIWHTYCICFNIKSEQWVNLMQINWKRCPEFQHMLEPQPGSPLEGDQVGHSI